MTLLLPAFVSGNVTPDIITQATQTHTSMYTRMRAYTRVHAGAHTHTQKHTSFILFIHKFGSNFKQSVEIGSSFPLSEFVS